MENQKHIGREDEVKEYVAMYRLNTQSGFFAKLARKHERMLLETQRELSELINDAPSPEDLSEGWEHYSISRKRDELACTAILFCAAAIEAHINDYGGRRLGVSYFEAHIEKLDPLSKWLIVPRIVCGEEIPKSGQAYELAKEILRWRNNLMHSKSRAIHDLVEQIAAGQRESEQLINAASKVSLTLDTLAQEAKRVDGADIYFGIGLTSDWHEGQ